MNIVYPHIGKNVRSMRGMVICWLLGALLFWLLLGIATPQASAQTSQSPDTAPVLRLP
jgi:hypothetical protein